MDKQPYVRLNVESAGRRLKVDQLVESIRGQILEDDHLRGCRLPPVRVLAHQLGLSKNTVQTAYEELKAQGLVESIDRMGLFVSQLDRGIEVDETYSVPAPKLQKLNVNLWPEEARDCLKLSSVFIDPRILPVEKLTACFRSVLKSPGIPKIYSHQGMPALREKIALRLRSRGMDVSAEHIIITNGSQQALDLVTRALVTKVVATENPAYYTGRYLFEMNSIETVGLNIDPFSGLEVEQWQQQLEQHRPGLVYLTTNYQNPNGYSYSSKEISQIVHWAREYGFGILEDDWGSDMLSYSEFRPGLKTLGGENVLYMNSFTKKLLPSLRVGYLVANDQSLEALLTAKKVSTIAVPSIIEAALFEFLDRGYFETHLKYIQEELDIRYQHCLSLLRELMPEEVKWTSPGGGPILWLELPKRVDLNVLRERLLQQGVQIQLSNSAFFGQPHLHGFKVGYANLNQAEMTDAIEIAVEVLKKML